jgi:hypothetical protein
MSGCADSLTEPFANTERTTSVQGACAGKAAAIEAGAAVQEVRRTFRVRIATSAVTPGVFGQRKSLESKRSEKVEGRTAATPSRFERKAATKMAWSVCPDRVRAVDLPRTSDREVRAAVHPEEFSCRKNWLSARPRTNGESQFWKKDS